MTTPAVPVAKPHILAGRPAGEVVIILLTFTVSIVMLLGGIGIFMITIMRPEYDASNFWAAANQTITIVVGAVVGYVAGKGETTVVGRRAAPLEE